MTSKVITLRDGFVPIDELLTEADAMKRQHGMIARGVLYRDDGRDAFGRQIFTKVGENTVTLGGAIAALERLTGVSSSFRPNTLNEIMGLNDGYDYHPLSTPVALFGCGIGGASMTFTEVYDPSPRQNNLASLVPMMVSQNELTGTNAEKYMMRTTLKTPNNTTLNAWYLKEFDVTPNIRSLWKDAVEEDEDGTEITADVSETESENGVEAFANFKLVLTDKDVRSYFEAMGNLPQARINTIGLFLGEKVSIGDRQDYVNVSLFSVLNMNNEPLAVRKKITYVYRVYSMI